MQHCVPFSAIYDDITEDTEEFNISLRNANRQKSGTGAVVVNSDHDLVTITVVNATSPPPPDEGIIHSIFLAFLSCCGDLAFLFPSYSKYPTQLSTTTYKHTLIFNWKLVCGRVSLHEASRRSKYTRPHPCDSPTMQYLLACLLFSMRNLYSSQRANQITTLMCFNLYIIGNTHPHLICILFRFAVFRIR